MTNNFRKGGTGKESLTRAYLYPMYFMTLWIRQPVIGAPFPTILFFSELGSHDPQPPSGYDNEGKRSTVVVWIASAHTTTWHASVTMSTWLVSICNLFSDENTTLAFCSEVIHRYPTGDGFPINQATLLCTHQSVNVLFFSGKSNRFWEYVTSLSDILGYANRQRNSTRISGFVRSMFVNWLWALGHCERPPACRILNNNILPSFVSHSVRRRPITAVLVMCRLAANRKDKYYCKFLHWRVC